MRARVALAMTSPVPRAPLHPSVSDYGSLFVRQGIVAAFLNVFRAFLNVFRAFLNVFRAFLNVFSARSSMRPTPD